MDRLDAIASGRTCALLVFAIAAIALCASPSRAGSHPRSPVARASTADPSPTAAEFAALEARLEQQAAAFERLQATVDKQATIIETQQKRLDQLESLRPATSTGSPDESTALAVNAASSADPVQVDRRNNSLGDEDHRKKSKDESGSEKNLKRWGNIKVSGQIRIRFDSESNRALDDPEDLISRNRLRFRVRLGLSEKIDDHCDWGLRLTSGEAFGDGSENQTFDNFFSRKPFDIDRAFIHYTTDRSFDDDDKRVMFEATAGKQPTPWEVNSVNIDDQLQPEGLAETVRIKGPEDSKFKTVGFTAWEMVFDQRANQPDAILYGVNVNPEFELSENWRATGWLQFFYLHNFRVTDLTTGAGLADQPLVLANRHPINAIAEVDYAGWGEKDGDLSRWELALRGEWIYNADGPSHGKSAWDYDMLLGRLSKPGDWQFEGLYYRAGTDVFPLFLSSGEDLDSNAHGTEISATYLLQKKIQMRARYIGGRITNTDSPVNRWFSRFQFDVTYGF